MSLFYDWWKSGYEPRGRVQNFLQDCNHSDWSSQTGMHTTLISMMIYLDASSVEKNKPFHGALSYLVFGLWKKKKIFPLLLL